MLALYRTLSLRYLGRRRLRTLLVVVSIALGVATLVATRTLNDTMGRAVLASTNPLSGVVDFVIGNGDLPVPRDLAKAVAAVPGVRSVQPKVWDHARVQTGDGPRTVLVIGLDLAQTKDVGDVPGEITLSPGTEAAFLMGRLLSQKPAVVGTELDRDLPADARVVTVEHQRRTFDLVKAGTVEAHGALAMLSGYVVVLDLDDAAEVLGLPRGQVNRLDVLLHHGVNPQEARGAIEAKLAGRARVQTPVEQDQATGSAMATFRTGFALCGVAALVVGMFLVYNALSVTVAERRHEVGVLLALGATRGQVLGLFAGEALLLGLAGAALGIPLGLGLAYLGLQPMRAILNDLFVNLNVRQVDVSAELILTALAAGVVTTVGAALWPAIRASQENPAEAVRRVPRPATGRHLVALLAGSVGLLAAGAALTLLRNVLPMHWGTFGGLALVLTGALVASPLAATVVATGLRPVARRFFPIEWRLAADNLLQAPGRTGMVIGALAAGVSLVVQTAGVIRSNRAALRDWIEGSVAADVIVAAGSAVGSGQPAVPMGPEVGEALRDLPGAEAVVSLRGARVDFRGALVMLLALDGGLVSRLHNERMPGNPENALFARLDAEPDGALVSENFAALYGIEPGDTITVPAPAGPVTLHVVGKLVDFGWALGTVYVNRRDYLGHWQDPRADLYDVYVRPGHTAADLKEVIAARLGARYDLQPMTRAELIEGVERIIDRVYGIAYGQQVVVMLVAALGVITSLLISVLQRRREMGLLRAVGAAQGQVIHSVLAEACLMGAIGTLLGVLFGIPVQWYVLRVVILEEAGFLFPVHIPWSSAGLIALFAVLTATLAGLGPAIYAVRQRIPEAIAYE
jgi:putative ABC transport system permease protein